MLYVWKSPQENGLPSSHYSVEGFLNEDEAELLVRQNIGSGLSLESFESMEQFISFVNEQDERYLESLCDFLPVFESIC